MIAFLVLLVNLVPGKQKLIYDLSEQGAKALLVLRHKPQIIEADMKGVAPIKGFPGAIGCFIVGVFVDVSVHLLVVHKLGGGYVVVKHI